MDILSKLKSKKTKQMYYVRQWPTYDMLCTCLHCDFTEETCGRKSWDTKSSRGRKSGALCFMPVAAIISSQGDMICLPVVTYFNTVGSPSTAALHCCWSIPTPCFIIRPRWHVLHQSWHKEHWGMENEQRQALNCGFVADKFAHTKMENLYSINFSSMNTCQLIKLLNRFYVIVTRRKALALNTREQCNFTYLY